MIRTQNKYSIPLSITKGSGQLRIVVVCVQLVHVLIVYIASKYVSVHVHENVTIQGSFTVNHNGCFFFSVNTWTINQFQLVSHAAWCRGVERFGRQGIIIDIKQCVSSHCSKVRKKTNRQKTERQ